MSEAAAEMAPAARSTTAQPRSESPGAAARSTRRTVGRASRAGQGLGVSGGMDVGTARRLVMVSMVVSGGVITYDLLQAKRSGKLPPGEAWRVIWATAVLFFLLTIAADLIPGVAGPLAGLIALSILVGRSAAVNQIANVIPSKGANA